MLRITDNTNMDELKAIPVRDAIAGFKLQADLELVWPYGYESVRDLQVDLECNRIHPATSLLDCNLGELVDEYAAKIAAVSA